MSSQPGTAITPAPGTGGAPGSGAPPPTFSLSTPTGGVTGSWKLDPVEHDWDRIVRLGKDVIQFLVFVGMFVGGTGLCVYGTLATGITPEMHALALQGLTGAAGGVLGYLVKKNKES